MVSVDVKRYVYLLTEIRKRIRDGEPRTATSTFTQLLSSEHLSDDDELILNVLRCHETY